MTTNNAAGRSRRLDTGWPPARKAGCCYTLHYRDPIGNTADPRGWAQHYVGWSAEHCLEGRISDHREGRCGVPLVMAFWRAGIPFAVDSVERGVTRDRENQLKLKGASRRCPACQGLVSWEQAAAAEQGLVTP